jgi:hypothetical protein
MNYLGYLQKQDPLFEFLRHEIFPMTGARKKPNRFKVYSVLSSNHVYVYEDPASLTRVVGKFYGNVPGRHSGSARGLMEREFNNIVYLRGMGFTGYPHYVVRPLGQNADLNCLLAEEFCYGAPFHNFIIGAIQDGGGKALYEKLTALAYFLAAMHNRTAGHSKVAFEKDCAYFDRIVKRLMKDGHIKSSEVNDFLRLKETWANMPCMWEDQDVLVHGDVTPTNILFGAEMWVIVVDLERMKRADRVFDVGRVAGELKHFFMQYSGDGWPAEPYIGHFLWEYSCHFPDRHRAFDSITQRVPFYMGLNLLRIARNTWIGPKHRIHLLQEAKNILM